MKIVIAKSSNYSLSSDVISRYFELENLGKPYFYVRDIYTYNLKNGISNSNYKRVDKIDEYFLVSKNNLGEEVLSDNLLFSDDNYFDSTEIKRDDVNLILAIEEINPDNLKIVEIPDDVKWYIYESEEGYETIEEEHRIWS